MTKVEFTYLSQEDVIAAGGLDVKMLTGVVENVFRLFCEGKVVMPTKIVMPLPPGERERGRMNALVAYVGGDWEVAGVKWIPGIPSNPYVRNLPRANAMIILSDTTNGMPRAIMDGTLISAMRTGVVAGVAAKHLARSDSRVVAMIGMGVQARTQAMALAEVLPDLEEIRGYGRRKEKAEEVAKEISERTGIRTRIVNSPEEAVRGADIIDTVTYADEPIVKNEWVKTGSMFVHIGSYVEEEFDVILQSSKIVVDDWDAVKHRKTPVLARMYDQGKITDDDIYATLPELVAGKKPGRETPEERIFFAENGMPYEDIAIATKLLEIAKMKGIGQRLRLWNEPLWV